MEHFSWDKHVPYIRNRMYLILVGKSDFPGYNVKMPCRSRAPGKYACPQVPHAARGLPQTVGSALGAGIFASVPPAAMAFCPIIFFLKSERTRRSGMRHLPRLFFSPQERRGEHLNAAARRGVIFVLPFLCTLCLGSFPAGVAKAGQPPLCQTDCNDQSAREQADLASTCPNSG